MHPPRLYCPSVKEGTIAISKEEAHHAVSVLRLRAGDEVVLFDGAGKQAGGRVKRADRHRFEVIVEGITEHPFELPHRLTIALSMPKAHRQGYLIEKCTELGVAAIQPIITERSVSGVKGRAVTRWTRRAIEAAKQSGRHWVPAIEKPMGFRESLSQHGKSEAKAIADLSATAGSFYSFLEALTPETSIAIWIGPEGGWSDSERHAAARVGAQSVKLGPTVLRTETAAVAVCAAVAMLGTGDHAVDAVD